MGLSKIGKPIQNMIVIVLQRGFSWLGENLIENVREGRTLQVWRIVVSIFEMDQNQNQLDPSKAVYILKNIFQYFFHLVFQIHLFLKGVIFVIFSKFIIDEKLQYFTQHLLLGQVIFEYIYFLLFATGFIYINSFFIIFAIK